MIRQQVLASFAPQIVTIPREQWGRLATPVEVVSREGQTVSVDVLGPDIIECIRKWVGDDTTVERKQNGLLVKFNNGNDQVTIYLPAYWDLTFPLGIVPEGRNLTGVNDGPIAVSKTGGTKYLKVVEAITDVCKKKPSEKEIQTAVATREGKKAYKAMLGWQGPAEDSEGSSSSSSSSAAATPRRRELPAEVALRIAKYAAVKKHEGGRKKSKKAKKMTRRR